VKVAIRDSALQTFRDWDVVFLYYGGIFEVLPVQMGRRNKEWVEITSGLSEGDEYVTENSYILKADLEKSGAKHDH
jgi:cobalt-zinc-cadmium efflux system membrane fusion protein